MGLSPVLETPQGELRPRLSSWTTWPMRPVFPSCGLIYQECFLSLLKYSHGSSLFSFIPGSIHSFHVLKTPRNFLFEAGLKFRKSTSTGLYHSSSSQSQSFYFQDAFRGEDYLIIGASCFCRSSLCTWFRPKYRH
jgi:hypothetical protein